MNEFEVRDTYDIGYTRRQITDHMKKLEFSEKEIAEVSIVVNEICSNMVKHAVEEGKIKYYQIDEEDRTGIEIVAEDKGPGIENVDEVLKDGVSSKGTMGGGFGAIRRLSDFFEISSKPKRPGINSNQTGTRITVRKWRTASLYSDGVCATDINVSVLSKPYKGFTVNGDSYYIKSINGREIIALIDGLGHGSGAYEAACRAVKAIDDNIHKSVEDIIKIMNMELKNTRGAVTALFIIDKFEKEFEMLSIGNIDSRYISGTTTERLFSYNGFVGGFNGNFKAGRRGYKKGDMLILCTDGISSKWEIENYTIGSTCNPTDLCNRIFKEYSRDNDDATILIALL